jgi:hypothetical protein
MPRLRQGRGRPRRRKGGLTPDPSPERGVLFGRKGLLAVMQQIGAIPARA